MPSEKKTARTMVIRKQGARIQPLSGVMVPRKLHKNWKSLSTERKKELMIKTRAVAYRLAASSSPSPTASEEHGTERSDSSNNSDSYNNDNDNDNDNCEKQHRKQKEGGNTTIRRNYPFLEVTQKGKPIPNPSEETVKGPIRLRLLPLPLPPSS
eukprot:jgi/Psemu1/65306/estExt_Genemark1.C_1190058